MVIKPIIDQAIGQNKNILVLGSPRSGTHALGDLLGKSGPNTKYLGEICQIKDQSQPWQEIYQIFQHDRLYIGQIVSMVSKIRISHLVQEIKKHSVIVNIRRRNKIDQFASWMYFHTTGGIMGKWHNHESNDTKLLEGSITASDEDIDHFLLEQLLDDFFLADFFLCYEDMDFSGSFYKKNQYSYDIKKVFSNLDYVEERLSSWCYSEEHFYK